MSMTPTQQTALEALAGRALTAEEVAAIGTIWDDDVRPDAQIADIISAGRTEVYTRLVSARGLAEHVPGGPLAAEVILMKLEGAAATMLASADQPTKVMGSLLQRQLGFLASDGLDFGSAALRGMLDQFAAASILTSDEVAGLKAIAVRPAPISARAVTVALNGV